MVEKQFTNKVVIVTGGSQGIGFACAKRFQEEGAIVCVIQRSQSKNF
jgi:meso-butanediol dehydrogenase/(S,S)-butanediol dehydrogenase/diacetyl reductase